MRWLFSLLAMLVAPVGSASPVPSAPDARRLVEDIHLSSKSFTLPNGLRVVVQEDRRLPIVVMNLWYGVASRDERPGQHGYAHLVEHLGFVGTPPHPAASTAVHGRSARATSTQLPISTAPTFTGRCRVRRWRRRSSSRRTAWPTSATR